jgi:hypothetical protein
MAEEPVTNRTLTGHLPMASRGIQHLMRNNDAALQANDAGVKPDIVGGSSFG